MTRRIVILATLFLCCLSVFHCAAASFSAWEVFTMPFHKFVEIGRIAVLQDGVHAGKIAAIVDVIDQNRVLIDGPCTGIPRQEYRIRKLHLTPLTTKFPFSARSRVVRKVWESEKISQKWTDSAWAKRMAMKARRAALNDFDRFKLSKAKSIRNKIVTKAFNIKKRKLVKAKKL